MGYIHDQQLAWWMPPGVISVQDGLVNWAAVHDGTAWSLQRAGGTAGSFLALLPCLLPQHLLTQRGSRLSAVELWYWVGTAALLDFGLQVEAQALPEHGASWTAAAAQAGSHDSGHDTLAKRTAAGSHRLVYTLSAPAWAAAGERWQVTLSGQAALASELRLYGACLHFTLRL